MTLLWLVIFGNALFRRTVQASCPVPVANNCHADGCCGNGVTNIEEGELCWVQCQHGFEADIPLVPCSHDSFDVACIEDVHLRSLAASSEPGGPSGGPSDLTPTTTPTPTPTRTPTLTPTPIPTPALSFNSTTPTPTPTWAPTLTPTPIPTPALSFNSTTPTPTPTRTPTLTPTPIPTPALSFNSTISLSAADAIASSNSVVATYLSELENTYGSDAVVDVTPIFKMKVTYTFSGTVTEGDVKAAIATRNNVPESAVIVVISTSSSRRLGPSRRLQGSTVAAEIAADQSQLAALQTAMGQDLEVGGMVATASEATVDIELVTIVTTQSAAVPPSHSVVAGFFDDSDVQVVVAGISMAEMPTPTTTITPAFAPRASGVASGAERLSRPFATILIFVVFHFAMS